MQTKSACNVEYDVLRMKNDGITNNIQMFNLIMKHIEDNIDRPTVLLTYLFFSLHAKNAAAIDTRGTSTQMLDTFADIFFYRNTMAFFVIPTVASAC